MFVQACTLGAGEDKRPEARVSITSGALNCSSGRLGALCATVFYRKRIKDRLYPKAARTGPYAFAEEVRRVDGMSLSRYVVIGQVAGSGQG